MLCSWPLLHTESELTRCTAGTIVQAYSLPLHQLKASKPCHCWWRHKGHDKQTNVSMLYGCTICTYAERMLAWHPGLWNDISGHPVSSRGFCSRFSQPLNLPVFVQELMGKYEAVNKGGWQAFGAIQALLSREAVLKDLTLNELQSLFRWALAPCPTAA